jgi:hypothetical protein
MVVLNFGQLYRLLWSYFLSAKNELCDTVLSWLATVKKILNLDIKTINCDNAGENKRLLAEVEKSATLKVKFEITAPNTPQQNGKIERQFATMWDKVRAMLNAAKLPWKIRNKLWAQCAKHCTDLENILVKKGNVTL